MPYPPLKTQTYDMVGGINTKASLYITDETEFLQLQNVDFRTVGALSSFAGSTQYSLTGSTSKITGIQDYARQEVTGYTLVQGFTLTLYAQTTSLFATDAFNVTDAGGRTFALLYPYIGPGNLTPTSFAYLNYQYGANALDFWTWPNSFYSNVIWQYSLGKPAGSVGSVVKGTTNAGGMSGFLKFYFAIAREDGFIGPARAVTVTCLGETVISLQRYPGQPNLNVNSGLSFGSFGASGIVAWMQLNDSTPMQQAGLFGLTTGTNTGITAPFNFTAGGGGWTTAVSLPEDFLGTFLYGAGTEQGASNNIHLNNVGSGPNVIETFFNQLFCALGSRVFYSDIGEPDKKQYDNFFDIALDTPDAVSMMKAYFTQLIIAKPNRVYALNGTEPDNFNLSLVSSEYGCLSHRAACVWNQQFWFLDKKGIMEFNGGNIIPTSNKVEDIFNRMNVTAASREAIMIHVKERNEVWTAIPVDGSTINNIIVIYDYLAKAWTTRTCPSGGLAALLPVNRGLQNETVYYGTSTGLIGTFGSSFTGDNGQNFTSVITSRFVGDLGDSVMSFFRRLYLDVNVPSGQTYVIPINLYTDRNLTTPAYQTTMVLSDFQNRIDFGLPAVSMAVQLIYSGSQFLQVNGFTVEYRFQRNVSSSWQT